ncbi:protein FAM91A1-like isoform X3 [Salvia hispanica]|uniref:protein FAM91A1-like isoform X3 n=1 Tax=Salvia hispanica TaxID=49212 RepID=UPI00200949AB|nr:protein FAM91A1-like isoform X3 [Salvia hispanica]
MLRPPETMEEQLIIQAITEECPWENLPKRLQSTLNSKEDWHRRIIDHCIKKRLPWNTCFARMVCKEAEYYEEMMRYLRRNLAMYPYHLAEYVNRVMRVSPFKYYCDILFEVMKNEQPYDSIPNFSAADALRITGIGRNEFIDIMNKCRSKKIMWKLNKSIAKELLPIEPVEFVIEPWWGVCLVNFTLEEFKKKNQHKLIKSIRRKPILSSYLIRKLLRVYFAVGSCTLMFLFILMTVSKFQSLKDLFQTGSSHMKIPLKMGCVSRLLYAVFVVSSENSTVAELALTLQADIFQLQAAASFVCRLGWAVKLIDPASILQDSYSSGSPRSMLSDDEVGSHASMGPSSLFGDGSSRQSSDVLWTENSSPSADCSSVAFVVDANITSYLMMGSVSPGLKSHAVTLYEAGKLGHTSIADLCNDLMTLEGAKFEGGLQEFANHAFSLRCILECLTSGGTVTDERQRVTKEDTASLTTDACQGDSSQNSVNKTDDTNDSVELSGTSIDDTLSTTLSKETSSDAEDSNFSSKFEEISDSAESLTARKDLKKIRKYRVDILRCESLAALSPATLSRLFRRDYDIVMSMIPLPHSSVLPGSKGPVHFGPPTHSSMTPWMKLVLYTALSSGPLSVVMMKGQCLRLLPVPLAGCEKALIWSWDGSTVGGLGGNFEGNLVNGSILLHCLNSLLKHSAVLVQPLSKNDLDDGGNVVTLDVPLPLKNSDGSVACIGEELGLSGEECSKLNILLHDISKKINLWTIGYIRLLRLFNERKLETFSVDKEKYEWVVLGAQFGVPLFSPQLCNSICRRVVSSQLLQTDLSSEYHEAMQDLRGRLLYVCSEYQASGPTARLLNQKEHVKEKESSQLLMNYASGRWNPIAEPSSPISGALSENQRLKLANRHRAGTEVLSFDGNILRSCQKVLTPKIGRQLPHQVGIFSECSVDYTSFVQICTRAQPLCELHS